MGTDARSLKELFLAALEAAPGDRAGWLLDRCPDDPLMRDRLERMLAAHDAPRLAMELPLLAGVAEETPGTTIGPYELIERIGEGGMGTVWLAAQAEPLPRRVALKIVRPELGTPRFVGRFEAELQALALMDHPNIARVLDAGRVADGRPFLALEFVRGRPITDYSDEHRLTVRQRLELFLPVCQAVQHAHQKGVIHRDLKPNNVVVGESDGRPVPKVIDFGIAKSTEPRRGGRPTAAGVVVGTPEYMSPEQATLNNADIDTRSDVYSLGAMLYELLTDAPPVIGGADLLDTLRRVREEEPVPPSRRLAEARGDLDAIVLKALEKDRSRRYQSAGELAADLQRHLSEEPVLARPPSLGYRLRKLARRNKGRLAAACVGAAALLVAAGGVGWAVADRAARRAEAAGRVELILADADRLAEAQRWDEALAAARRAEAVAGDGDARVAEFLRDAEFVARLDKIREAASVWKDGGFDYAGADATYQEVFRDFGLDPTGEPAAPAGRVAYPAAVALDHWASLRCLTAGAAEPALRPLADLATRLDADPLRVRLRRALGREADPAVREELCGLAADAGGQGPATLSVLASSLKRARLTELHEKILRRGQERFPDDFWLNLALANALRARKGYAEAAQFARAAVAVRPDSTAAWNNLGNALLDVGRPDEAEACYRRAVALDAKFAYGHRNIGHALVRRGDHVAAGVSFRQSLALSPKDSATLNHLATTLDKLGQADAALACMRRAVEVDPNDSASHSNLGLLLSRKGRRAEAIASYRAAIRLDPKNAKARVNLGNALLDQGNLDDAAAEFRRAIEIDPDSAGGHNGLGGVLAKRGKFAEAVVECRRAVALDPASAANHANLGQALARTGDVDAAATSLREAIRLDPKHAETHYQLAALAQRRGQMEESVASLRAAVEVAPRHVRAHNALGVALSYQGKLGDAAACFRRVIEIDPKHGPAHLNLGNVLMKLGRWDEGVATLRRAAELDPKNPLVLHELARHLMSASEPDRRRPDEALALARRAAEVAPSATTLETLAEAATQAGQPDEARKARRRLAELRQPKK